MADERLIQKTTRNFRHRDLSGMDLQNVDLSGANLTDANLTRANLDGADFTNAGIEGTHHIERAKNIEKAKGLL